MIRFRLIKGRHKPKLRIKGLKLQIIDVFTLLQSTPDLTTNVGFEIYPTLIHQRFTVGVDRKKNFVKLGFYSDYLQCQYIIQPRVSNWLTPPITNDGCCVVAYLFKLNRLPIQLNLGLDANTLDVVRDGLRVVLDATDQCVLVLARRLWICPDRQLLKWFINTR